MGKMKRQLAVLVTLFTMAMCFTTSARAQVAGTSGANDLVVAQGGATSAVVVVADGAGQWEKQAAADLANYIGLMSGATPQVVGTIPAGNAPLFVVGQAAFAADASLRTALNGVVKKNPTIRADAIVVRR